MSDNVQFDEFQGSSHMRPQMQSASSNNPKMVQWLLKKGILKTEGQAKAFLVAVVIINFTIMAFVIKLFL